MIQDQPDDNAFRSKSSQLKMCLASKTIAIDNNVYLGSMRLVRLQYMYLGSNTIAIHRKQYIFRFQDCLDNNIYIQVPRLDNNVFRFQDQLNNNVFRFQDSLDNNVYIKVPILASQQCRYVFRFYDQLDNNIFRFQLRLAIR